MYFLHPSIQMILWDFYFIYPYQSFGAWSLRELLVLNIHLWAYHGDIVSWIQLENKQIICSTVWHSYKAFPNRIQISLSPLFLPYGQTWLAPNCTNNWSLNQYLSPAPLIKWHLWVEQKKILEQMASSELASHFMEGVKGQVRYGLLFWWTITVGLLWFCYGD